MYGIIVKQCMQSKQSFVWHQAELNNYMHASVITYNALHWWHSNPSAWIKKPHLYERDFFWWTLLTRREWNARNSATSEFPHIVSASSDLSLVQGVQHPSLTLSMIVQSATKKRSLFRLLIFWWTLLTRSKWNARNSETSEFTHIVSASSDLSLVQGVQIKSRQSRVWNHCETMYAIKTQFCMASSQLTNYMHASVITYNALHWWHTNPSAWIKKSRPFERDFFGGDNRTRRGFAP